MTTTDAVGTTVLFENDRIRPWEMVLGAGERLRATLTSTTTCSSTPSPRPSAPS